MEVIPEQCRSCGYRWEHDGDLACQYILVTGRRRPAAKDGICPVREMSRKTFDCVTPQRRD